MHARSHALFAPVAARAVRCRRRMMCAMLPPSWIHAPRPYTHPATHITHTAPPLRSHHPPPPPHHQPQPPPCPPPDSAPTSLPPPPPPTGPAVTSTPQDTDMADWDVCETDGVSSMSTGDTELAAHATPTVNMDAIEARSDISGAAPWPKRRPRHDMSYGAEAAAPLARPREEEARACVIVECVRASRANCFQTHRLNPRRLSRSWTMTIAPLPMSTRCLTQSRWCADAWRRHRQLRSPRRGVRAQRRSPRTRIRALGPCATSVLCGDGAT
jgi:hypothetical protein